MGDDDGDGFGADGFAEDFAWVNEAFVGEAGGNFASADESSSGIEAQDPAFFDGEADGDGCEVFVDAFRGVHDEIDIGLLGEDASGDFDDGDPLEGFDFSDSGELLEVFDAPAEECPEASGFAHEASCEGEDVALCAAAAQEHGDEFGVAEGGGAEAFEAFLGAVFGGGFAEAVSERGGGIRMHGYFFCQLGVLWASSMCFRTFHCRLVCAG